VLVVEVVLLVLLLELVLMVGEMAEVLLVVLMEQQIPAAGVVVLLVGHKAVTAVAVWLSSVPLLVDQQQV
jgi:hypothetical protein